MKGPALVVTSILWFVIVFFVVFQMTFPSASIGRRVSHEIGVATNGAYAVDMRGIAPWWFGASATDLQLRTGAAPLPSADPVPPLVTFDQIGGRVGLFSLIQRTPHIVAALDMGGAHVDAVVDGSIEEDAFAVRGLDISADDVPVVDLLPLLSSATGADLGASGGLDLTVELTTEDTLRTSVGKVKLNGKNLILNTLSLPAMGLVDLELDVPIETFEFKLKADGGVAEVSKGNIECSLANIEVGGDITLNDALERSRLRLDVVIELNDWAGSPLDGFRSLVEGFMTSAKWGDGTYHYSVSGTFESLSYRPERETTRSVPTIRKPPVGTGTTRPPALSRDGVDPRRPSVVRDRPSIERPTKPSADVVRIGNDDEDDEQDYEEEEDEQALLDEISDEEFERLLEEAALEELLEDGY
jgi:type II secretion system protein N